MRAGVARIPAICMRWTERWWTYQKERFPLAAHGVLIAAFSYSAVCFSALLRGSDNLPGWRSALVAFVTCLLLFLQLRIADEFKDFEEDSRWRPYRAVPRGLVTLRQLGTLFLMTAAVQAALALWLDVRLLILLMVTWIYLALMTREFFAREWLKSRPVVYMTSHMAIMPLIDLYATSADWLPAQNTPPAGLPWFLFASYFNGLVIEIGRKIRVPEDEEEGVETYSALWGRPVAAAAWISAMAACAACAIAAASAIQFQFVVTTVALLAVIIAIGISISVIKSEEPKSGKRIEAFSALWTISLYTTLGIIPMFIRVFLQ